MKLRALLIQQGCAVALEGEGTLPMKMAAYKKVDILKKAYNTIMLSLIDELLTIVVD